MKKTSKESNKKSEIVIYKNPQNEVEMRVYLKGDSIWLNQSQIATLFGTQRPAITKHLRNIFQSGELEEDKVSSILEHTTKHGAIKGETQTVKVKFYNLDTIISVGYRVNSIRATQFRIWATKTLKQYLVKGYVFNKKQLLETKSKFFELQKAVSFLQEQSKKKLLKGKESEVLNLLSDYSKTLSLLENYDKKAVQKKKGKKSDFILDYQDCRKILSQLKDKLISKGEAGTLFAQEKEETFEGIIKGLYQTFEQKELYPTVEDKAANLLYLLIKDHPFIDGNKRSAAILFVYYLDKENYLFKQSGERKITANALSALTLLIAVSDPKEKEVMLGIVKNLISDF